MYKIWKQPLVITDEQTVKLPDWRKGYTNNLTIQWQHGIPVLWYLFEVNDPIEMADTTIMCYGTGNPINEDYPGSYIGTVQESSGLVWHFFEKHPPLSHRLDVGAEEAEEGDCQGP